MLNECLESKFCICIVSGIGCVRMADTIFRASATTRDIESHEYPGLICYYLSTDYETPKKVEQCRGRWY